MNHIYRNIWNASTGTFTAVAETATARGKRSGAVQGAAIVASILSAFATLPAAAQAVPSAAVSSGNTRTFVAPNGVTVVNIATPNAAGLSHNFYASFNVNPSGLVLNNGNSDVNARQSQLAGQVTANLNLTSQANVILNEVVSNNRSTLAGFTEVLGGRADVILANPYGITCTGCGFINTDRVTLTTGNPFLASSGGIGGFSVGQGDILITGTGLNATAQQVLDLVTRSVRIEAPINGADVSIATGTNKWDYASRAVTGAATPTGATPTYAIDSSALGGMYANRIRLVSTEAGVGVRMAGDAAASAGDFTLTAAGKVEMQSRASATGDVAVAAAQLALTDATVTSTGKTSLTATGDAAIRGGALVAGSDLLVKAATLTDSASASGLADNNLRNAGGALTLATSGSAALGATQWSAAGTWNGTFGNLAITDATKLYSTGGTLIASAEHGDLALGLAVLRSAGSMTLNASGRIATAGAAQAQAGALTLQAGNGLDNSGTLSADANSVLVRVGGSLTNSGQIHAAQTIDIADRKGGGSQALTNSGTLLADQTLQIKAGAINNLAGGRLQAANGSTITAASVDNAGTLLLSEQAGAAGSVTTLGATVNSGTLQGAGRLALTAGRLDNSGSVIAASTLGVATTGDVANSGTLQAPTSIQIASGGRIDNAAGGVLKSNDIALSAVRGLGNAGIVAADQGSITLRTDGTSTNSGQLQASGNIDIAGHADGATQTFVNSGKLLAAEALALKAASFTNASGGWTQAGSTSAVSGGSVTNAGTWLLSVQPGATDTLQLTGILDNSGILQSAGSAKLSTGQLTNSGSLLTAGALVASTAGAFNNTTGGTVQSDTLSVSSGGALTNASDAVLRARSVALTSTGLANAGTVTADAGTATLRVDGSLVNSGQVHATGAIDIADRAGAGSQSLINSGTLLAEQALALRASAVHNVGSGHIQAASGSKVAASSLDNAGTWLLSTQGGGSDVVTVTGKVDNTGTLQSAGNANLSAGSASNAGLLLAAGTLTGQATGNFSNAGTTQAGGGLALAANGNLTNKASGVLKGSTLALSAAQGLSNAGIATADKGAATLRVSGTFDNSGELGAAQAITIADFDNAASQTVVNSGKLITAGALGLQAASVTNQSSGFMQATSSTVEASSLANSGAWLLSTQGTASDSVTVAGTLTNSGTLQSAGTQTLSANALTNKGTLYAAGDVGITTTAGLVNSGLAQSGKALSLNSAGAMENQVGGAIKARSLALTTGGAGLTNAGTLTADAGDATLRVAGTLSNSGTVHASRKLDIADRSSAGSEAVTNSGLLIAEQALALRAAAVNNTATGRIQASTGSTANAASLTNAGNWLLSQQGSAADSVTVTGTLSNSGTLQGAGNTILTATSIGNTGKLLASGNLTANVSGSLSNGGAATVQAGQVLAINGSAASLSNASGGKLLGDGLALTVASLENAGVVQGGTRSDTSIAVGNTLNNRAGGVVTVASASSGAGSVAATTVTNAGRLQSAGALSVNVGTGGFGNAGTTIADGNVTVQSRAAGGDYVAAVGGLVQSGKLLSVSGGNATIWDVAGNGMLMGNRLTGTVGTINLVNGATLWSDDAMTLTLGKLTLAGADAAVLGSMSKSGTTSITTTQALVNNGLLFSSNDLTVSAPSITNALGTGGIAALHDATVRATTGDVTNSGALYAGNKMSVYAEAGTINNTATLTTFQGSVNAGSQVYLKANTVVNNSTISSDGGITIEATSLRNEVLGGDTRAYGAESAKTKTETGHDGKHYLCNNPFDGDCYDQHEYWRYQQTWSQSQTYTGGTPTVKPQIVGDGTVQLTFNSASNLGGVISGNTVNMTGSGTGAKFVNDDLALQKKEFKQTWTEHTQYTAAGPATYFEHRVEGETTTNTVSEISNIGAGVYAKTLTGSGFALTNNGSTKTLAEIRKDDTKNATLVTRSGQTETGGSLDGAVGGTTGANGSTFGGVGNASTTDGKSVTAVGGVAGAQGTSFVGVRTLNGQTAISFLAVNAANGVRGTAFGGINIPLPTNPNGLYVIAREPAAQYLVESNPRYRVGSNSVGSDYLARQLGYDPDTLVRRLGDSSYEAYLIKQQLIAQTGNNLLVGSQDASSQVQRLMDQAASQSKDLGLTYGQALTPEQQANLKQDIVWMVQTEVNGQVVLAPVVYLSAQSKANITQGAVISADAANLSLTSLTNTGGTISGSKSLNIVSVGDVTNTSGTITGGNVAVSSTQGGIVNQTATSGSGNDLRYVTDIGKTGTISSTSTLALVAAQDITNKGANVSAGGDASLVAGGNVTFDTLQNKTTDTTRGAYTQDGGSGTTTATTTRVEQIKSGLTAGGNLAVTAGKDITLAGTDTKVGGNADLNAGGNLNIVARENTTTSRTESQASGFGMGGAVYGSSTTTTDSTSVRNVGSTFEVGRNASLAAKKDVTVQGSTVDVGGKGSITATNVNVLAGRNYDETSSTTNSTSFLTVSNGGTQTSSSSGSNAGASTGKNSASASAGAQAETGSTSSGGLQLASGSTTTTKTTDLKNVASTLNFGGDLLVNASKDVNLVGSTVNAGGNATVNAQNINVVAAKDVATSSTTASTTSVGLTGSSDNKAGASAGADAKASGNVIGSASASASAQAGASTDNKLDLMQTRVTSKDTLDITNQGSAITSKGNTTLNATDTLAVQGSKVGAGGDVNLAGKDIRFTAATDVHETRETSNTTTAGLYASGEANASAGASVKAGTNTSAEASAKASAGLEVGLYGNNTQTSNVDGSTKAVVSGISAGGNVNRTATNGITDVGTAIEAGGNLTQSAKTITSLAAADTTYASSSSTSNTAKIGAYGEAEAGASAKGSLTGGANKVENGVSAGAGIKATYEYEKEGSQSASSKAVVSNIKVGGNVNSTSSGATTLEGTNIAAGKDVTIGASSLNYAAAQDTASASSSNTKAGASVGVDIVNKSASVGGSYENGKESSASTTAVVGGLNAGGNLTIKTAGDAKFEGTNLAAGGAATVDAGKNVVFDAAKNTSSASGQNVNASAGVTAGKKGASVEAEGGYSQAKSSGSDAVAGSIGSGGPLTVKSGGDTTFTGTSLASGGDTTVAAGGNLAFNAARSTSTSEGFGVSASVKVEGGKKAAGGKTTASKGGEAGVEATYSMSQSDTANGATLASGGNINLSSGKNTTLEGTQAKAGGAIAVGAGGKVDIKEAKSSSTSVDVGVAVAGSSTSEKTVPGTGTRAGSSVGAGAATGATSSAMGAGAVAGATGKNAANEKPTREGSGGLDLNVSADKSSQGTQLQGGKGVTIQSGVKQPAPPSAKEAKAAEAKAKADKSKAEKLDKAMTKEKLVSVGNPATTAP